MNHLSDDQWRFAVETALERCRFYPAVVDLLDFASEWPGLTQHALPSDTRTVEQKRADFRAGFEHFRKLVTEHLADCDMDDLAASKEWPK